MTITLSELRAAQEEASVWSLLDTQNKQKRPKNSVTISEYAEKTGYSTAQAGKLLRDNPHLEQVSFLQSGRRAVCYVPKRK